jgi:hypothetical protein
VVASLGISFLTPAGALVALAAVVPLVAYFAARRRVAEVRRALRLPKPTRPDRRAFAAVAVVILLALACAQPALTTGAHERVRRDAAVLFVFDTSRSMAASRGRRGATRLDRAVAVAQQLRASIPNVPAGIATFTDRVVPNLLPVVDQPTFDAVLQQSIGIEQPPPLEVQGRSTTFAALDEIPNGDYFEPSVRHAVAVLLTDGETKPFNAKALVKPFSRPPAIRLLAVRFWHSNEQVFGRHGPEAHYVPDPTSKELLGQLVGVTHGHVFSERQLGPATAALRGVVGHGSATGVARPLRMHPLAPLLAVLALVPLALAFFGADALRRLLPERAAQSVSRRTSARSIRAASSNPSRS